MILFSLKAILEQTDSAGVKVLNTQGASFSFSVPISNKTLQYKTSDVFIVNEVIKLYMYSELDVYEG